METFDVKCELYSFVFIIHGNFDFPSELDWSKSQVLATAPAALAVGCSSEDLVSTKFDATFHISENHCDWDDAFFAHAIEVDDKGFEVVEAVSTTTEADKGVVGLIFPLPWQGLTAFQFRAPTGFVEDGVGSLVPVTAEILVTPAPANFETKFGLR